MTPALPTPSLESTGESARWRRSLAPGLVAGALALATALFALAAVRSFPLGGLALNLALAWGAYSVLRVGVHLRPASHSWWVPSVAPWLATPMLLRMHLASAGSAMPSWVASTWTLEALAVVAAVAITLAYGHLLEPYATTRAALATTGVLGGALGVVLVLLHITMPQPVAPDALAVFGLTVLAVAAALAVQWLVLRRRGRWAVLAGGAALAATASQLLDGFVTYLAVVDPFDLLARDMHEQVALSAWLLEYTGIGYPIVKWLLALGIAWALEQGWRNAAQPAAQRTGAYFAVILLGLGPGLYSTANLLS